MNGMSKPTLKLDWCGQDAATYAVMNWHYSRAMPSSKLAKIGVWENGKFIGAIIYGLGATPNLCKPYGLTQQECCELVRVALSKHETPVSRIVAISMRILKRDMPGVRLVVSFADPSEGHHGGIYQAGGWLYGGKSADARFFVVNGIERHPRSIGSSGWVQSLGWLRANVDNRASTTLKPGKHRYLMPLDDEMRARIEPLRKPYPKRAGSADGGTAGIQPVGGGSNPTPALLSDRGQQ
jgi:hypothetical protein